MLFQGKILWNRRHFNNDDNDHLVRQTKFLRRWQQVTLLKIYRLADFVCDLLNMTETLLICWDSLWTENFLFIFFCIYGREEEGFSKFKNYAVIISDLVYKCTVGGTAKKVLNLRCWSLIWYGCFVVYNHPVVPFLFWTIRINLLKVIWLIWLHKLAVLYSQFFSSIFCYFFYFFFVISAQNFCYVLFFFFVYSRKL